MASNNMFMDNISVGNIYIMDDDKSHGVELNANNLSSDYVASFPTRSSNATIALIEELNNYKITTYSGPLTDSTHTFQSWTKRVVIQLQAAGGGGGGRGNSDYDIGSGGGAGGYGKITLCSTQNKILDDTLVFTLGGAGSGGTDTNSGGDASDSTIRFQDVGGSEFNIMTCYGGKGGTSNNYGEGAQQSSLPVINNNATYNLHELGYVIRGAGSSGGLVTGSVVYMGGKGADSVLGVGGISSIMNGTGNATAGYNGGGGGGGAFRSTTDDEGEVGGNALLIIEEYPY